MQATKLRARPDGLVPAGAYFTDIAAKLEELNAREATRREALDGEDRGLEAIYRSRSMARQFEAHAVM